MEDLEREAKSRCENYELPNSTKNDTRYKIDTNHKIDWSNCCNSPFSGQGNK